MLVSFDLSNLKIVENVGNSEGGKMLNIVCITFCVTSSHSIPSCNYQCVAIAFGVHITWIPIIVIVS